MRYRNSGGIIQPGINITIAPNVSSYSYTYYLNTWGLAGAAGILGLGNTTSYSSPKQVGALVDWANVYAGQSFNLSIKTDGSLWAWGQGGQGSLGLGNTTNYSSPKQVGALTNWALISPNTNGVISIKKDGSLWSWGYNQYGALGLGNTTYSFSSPQQVGSLTNWQSLGSGGYSVHAIKTDGTLWAWAGPNSYGQLGLGAVGMYSSPKQVGSLTNWSKIVGAQWHCVALKTDGTLWTWGANGSGQLGIGNTSQYNSPKQVGALTSWLRIGSGAYSSFGIKTDGTFWTWGYNASGNLGLGNTTPYSSPKQVGALTNWSKLASDPAVGYTHFAIKTDGSLWAWGGPNTYGQLGLGNLTNYSSPKQVGALTSWWAISSSNSDTIGLLY